MTSLSNLTSQTRLDLGIRKLVGEWRSLLTMRYLQADIVAGLVLACVAIPLSLAIALASSVPPAVGITTAVIAAVVCALFGGTPLGVSGPAAAMSVLVGSIVEEHSLGGLLVVGFVCGILQLATGVLGFGRVIRFIPITVVHGFTAGVGAIILIGQLPRALGLPPPDEAHALTVITHLRDFIQHTNPAALIIAVLSLGITYGLPSLVSRIPAPLVAVVVPTLIAWWLKLDVAVVGEVPRVLPTPSFNKYDWGALHSLLSSGVIIYLVASLETLLSSSSIDKLAGGKPHDPDQELIGQGLSNMVVSSFGGIPVTSVIVRSSLNVFAGGKTRRAAIFHSVFVLIIVGLFAPLVEMIPIAALAGILLSVAIRMLSPKHFIAVGKISLPEAGVFALTFFSMVFVDLLVGVQAGVVAALLATIAKVTENRVRTVISSEGLGPSRVAISGPLTFVSTSKMDRLREQVSVIKAGESLVVDLSGVSSIDASGTEVLFSLLSDLRARRVRYAVLTAVATVRDKLVTSDQEALLVDRLVSSESQIADALGEEPSKASATKLLMGVRNFHENVTATLDPLFQDLALGQSPHTMVITCADSRVAPELMTGCGPGELFTFRNLGAVVPPAGDSTSSTLAAAIEYAVTVLKVTNMVVCVHSKCGAMNAIHGTLPSDLEHLKNWKAHVLSYLKMPSDEPDLDAFTKKVAMQHLTSLKTYQRVKELIESSKLNVQVWFYDLEHSRVQVWNEAANAFVVAS